jgi:formylglycine-generating enzyme required for sulfatase activity
VGNVSEWVADWVPRSVQASGGTCGEAPYTWDKNNGVGPNGYACLMGAAPDGDPGALYRGGNVNESSAGVFAITGLNSPQSVDYALGFRAVH